MEINELPSYPISFPNSSFEHGLTEIGYFVDSGSIDLDGTVAITGNYSLKMIPSSTSTTWQTQTHPFNRDISGRTFSISAHIKTSNLSGGVRIAIYWLNSSGNWIWSNIVESSTLMGTNDWQKISIMAIAPAEAISLTAIVIANPGSGTYWIDSVEGYEIKTG